MIETEIVKGLMLGAYFVVLAMGLAALELALLAWKLVPVGERSAMFIMLNCMSLLGMVVGVSVGYATTPGTISTVIPAVLTFLSGLYVFMFLRETTRTLRLLAGIMVSAFATALVMFLFAGLRLRAVFGGGS